MKRYGNRFRFARWSRFHPMESVWIGSSYRYDPAQFGFEVSIQFFGDHLIARHRFRYVLADGGMILGCALFEVRLELSPELRLVERPNVASFDLPFATRDLG